jgi:anti-anti-sigma factor
VNVLVSDHPTTDATIVTLSGQLDIDTAAQMHAIFDRLRAESIARVVVDLGHLVFCDSTGLSALKLAHNYCTHAGGYLRLAGLTRSQRQLLAAIGLAQVLPTYRDVVTACTGDLDGLVPAPRRESWPIPPVRNQRDDRFPVNRPAGPAPNPTKPGLVKQRHPGVTRGLSTVS